MRFLSQHMDIGQCTALRPELLRLGIGGETLVRVRADGADKNPMSFRALSGDFENQRVVQLLIDAPDIADAWPRDASQIGGNRIGGG